MTKQREAPELIPAVWVESTKPYLMHRVAGRDVTPGKHATYRFATACGESEVPADQALFYNSHHRANCPGCLARSSGKSTRDETRSRQWIEATFPRLKTETGQT